MRRKRRRKGRKGKGIPKVRGKTLRGKRLRGRGLQEEKRRNQWYLRHWPVFVKTIKNARVNKIHCHINGI